MTQTLALTVNVALGLATLGALALIIRLAHRPSAGPGRETVHPSKPLPLAVVRVPDADDLSDAA
jgi:hypothetical protein